MIYTAESIDNINSAFKPLSSQKIARYLGFENFTKMIDNNELWLSNSRKFSDKNEGEIPYSFFQNWPKESRHNYSTLQKLKGNIYQAFISCWFEFTMESEPMWKAYGGEKVGTAHNSKGVCIISDVSKLAMYTHYLETQIYKVKYIDYKEKALLQPPFYFSMKTEAEIPVFSERVFFVYKQKEYQEEKEIRAITYQKSNRDGIGAKIDPNDFIENIIINPHATIENKKEIMNYLVANQLENKLIESKIKCRY